jgi:hypothetical protein
VTFPRWRAPGTYVAMSTERDTMRCPICGVGVLADIAYENPDPDAPPDKNDGDSVEIFTFTCGHETRGGKLGTSNYDAIDVEHRRVDDMVVPPDGEGGE